MRSEAPKNDAAPAGSPPVLMPGQTYTKVSAELSDRALNAAPWGVMLGFGLALGLTLVLFMSLTYLFITGIGIFGTNTPVAWAFPIVSFVWWIGIGHAGTFISAFLLIMRQDWRASINRFAEAMTLFAVACAGLMPILHLGRPWVFYWLFPYPNTMGLWPQWQSPLVWDVFAVSTYALVSILFWFLGALPDFATLRDRAQNRWIKRAYGLLALGWRGSSEHWRLHKQAYLMVGALAVPLVISVHSIVGMDFAVAIVPGWHSTIFPPYFVAGALYSGFAMVLTLGIPLRYFYKLGDYLTARHLQNCAKLMLVNGLIVTYGYVFDYFSVWYSASAPDILELKRRFFGDYAVEFWLMTFCNVGVIQLVWLPKIRRSAGWLFAIALLVNVGMWLERYIIVIGSLSSDYLPAMWQVFHSTIWDWAVFIGSIGLFSALWFLFIRFVPISGIFELRELTHKQQKGELEYQRLASLSAGEEPLQSRQTEGGYD